MQVAGLGGQQRPGPSRVGPVHRGEHRVGAFGGPAGLLAAVDGDYHAGGGVDRGGQRGGLPGGQRRGARGDRGDPGFGGVDRREGVGGDHRRGVAAVLVALLGQAEQDLARPVDRGGGGVQHWRDVGAGAGRRVPDERDQGLVRVAVVAHADHDAVPEPVDQLPGPAGGGQAGGQDFGVGEAVPAQLVDDRGGPVRRVADLPPAIDGHATAGQVAGGAGAVGAVELRAVERRGDRARGP